MFEKRSQNKISPDDNLGVFKPSKGSAKVIIGDGVKIKKFHSKLFNSVSNSDKNLQPVFIRYPIDYPEKLDSDDKVCWADKTQTLLKITIRCLGRKNTKVLLYFGDLIETSHQSAYELAKKSANSVMNSLDNL